MKKGVFDYNVVKVINAMYEKFGYDDSITYLWEDIETAWGASTERTIMNSKNEVIYQSVSDGLGVDTKTFLNNLLHSIINKEVFDGGLELPKEL